MKSLYSWTNIHIYISSFIIVSHVQEEIITAKKKKNINCVHHSHFIDTEVEAFNTDLYKVRIFSANAHLCLKLSVWLMSSVFLFHFIFFSEIWHVILFITFIIIALKIHYMLIFKALYWNWKLIINKVKKKLLSINCCSLREILFYFQVM